MFSQRCVATMRSGQNILNNNIYMQAYKSADCAFGTLTPYLALMYAISDYSFPNRVLLCLHNRNQLLR